jgi:uncharacterized phiE125 gp8 family phage protein
MLKLKTAPIVEPVLNTDIQTYLRLDSTAYNTTLTNYAIMARRQAEDYTRRAFINQTWYLMLDAWEIPDVIKIPRPPLVSATITTYDDNGTPSTQAPASYTVDTYSEPGRISLNPGYAWNYTRDLNGMLIEFVAGYGAASTNVPVDIIMAITEAAALYYNSGELGYLPRKIQDRLKPYQVIYL